MSLRVVEGVVQIFRLIKRNVMEDPKAALLVVAVIVFLFVLWFFQRSPCAGIEDRAAAIQCLREYEEYRDDRDQW